MKKRFIEWDLPLAEISEESAREKSIRHGHPSTLHIWWARRPLASSRATNFAALIDLPDDLKKRKEITELIKKITPWEAVKNGNDENIKKAQQMIKEQWGDNPPKVLDPFAGGGSIPLEALRLGCETYASDYNPVAVFIEKATLEWPQKFGIMIPHPEKEAGIDGEVEKVNFLTYMVEKWANIVLEHAKEEIGQFYPEEPDGSIPVGYIWARTILCQNPSCGAEIPLVRQFWLAKKKNKKIAYKPVVDNDKKKIEFEIVKGDIGEFDPSEGTIARGNAICPICTQITEVKKIRSLAQSGQMGERLVVVVLHMKKSPLFELGRKFKRDLQKNRMEKKLLNEFANNGYPLTSEAYVIKDSNIKWKVIDNGKLYHIKEKKGLLQVYLSGKFYRLAARKDIEIFGEAEKYLQSKVENWKWLDNPLPDEELPPIGTLGFRIQRYGMTQWHDLFNPRQKLALITFMEKIKVAYDGIKEDCQEIGTDKHSVDMEEAAKAVIGYLGIILDRLADKCSSLARWNNAGEKIEATSGRNALGMMWDYSELNVFSGVNGDWKANRDWVVMYITRTLLSDTVQAQVIHSSATALPFPDNYFDAILTDPPYYDNVPYADLSDFFYVWLKRSVGELFPNLFSTPLTPKSQEAIAEPMRQDKPEVFFENMLSDSFKEMHRILRPNGIATIVYAHKTTEGWETMLNSLVNANLVVTASWPLHTEMASRLRARSSAALASSIYMVCRKTERKKVGFYSELQPKIKERIETKLQQFWTEGIAGGDFFISAIGPGMEIFSQYEKVEKLDGKQVTTAELLNYIRSVSTDFIVGKLLKGASSSNIDSESEFYLAYRWTHLDNTVEYDDARKLAIASDVSLEELWGPSGFVKKSGSKISVLGPKDRGEFGSVNSMVDVMHKVLLLWEKSKKDEIAELLARTGFQDDPAFKQFCQAIAECLLNGNKEKQLLEGFLIGIDNYARVKVKVPKSQTDLKQFGGRLK